MLVPNRAKQKLQSGGALLGVMLTLKDPSAWQPEPEEREGASGAGGSTDWDLYVKQSEKAKAEGQKVQEVMV